MRFPAQCIVGLMAIFFSQACLADADEASAGSLADLPIDFRTAPFANDAPSFVRAELPVDSARSLPGFRAEANELSYRWWTSRGRADLGVGLGTLAYAVQRDEFPRRPGAYVAGVVDDRGAAVLGTATVLTLGMRYRTSDRSTLYADAAGVRARGFDGGDAVVGKVGVEFKSAQSRWNIAYGGLGLRLDGDTRMTVRLRKGGLAFFMRRAF